MRKALFILLVALISGSSVYSQAAMNTNVNTRAKFKSLFIFNFVKFTEWPEEYKQGDFIIGVYNDDDLAKVLEDAAKVKKVNSQNVVVKRLKSPSDVSKCHVLYVAGNTSSAVEPAVNKAKDYNCLVITEGSGMIERLAAINFVVVGNGLKFEMNKKAFTNKGLAVSNSLEKLATNVIN